MIAKSETLNAFINIEEPLFLGFSGYGCSLFRPFGGGFCWSLIGREATAKKTTRDIDEFEDKGPLPKAKTICEPVSSTDLVTAVLRGLNPDYAMIVTAILNFPPLPRFEDFRARLLFYESQLLGTKPVDFGSTTALITTQSSSPIANITHGPSYGHGQSCGNGRNGRRGNSHRRGRAPWHSTPDYSTYGCNPGILATTE
ncbi:hypothetical protein LWI29_024308 [Acer saccharum]|uniref:Uncharacterized protein n=1 Tax=Acer saccharum TaxID=4024 RepID=A0AA39VTM2_ACESA|nr:hypothetical protein LWI29_024308 [Acer saccharum]